MRHALRGIAAALKGERNLRIQSMAAFYAIGLAWLCGLEPWAKCAVLLCCGLVLALEIVNSALEALCDRVSKERDSLLGKVKDMAAAAVLTAALASLAVAVLLFARAEVRDKLVSPAVLWRTLPTLPFAFWFIAGSKKWNK